MIADPKRPVTVVIDGKTIIRPRSDLPRVPFEREDDPAERQADLQERARERDEYNDRWHP